tara:strand:+ start:108 stop:350 length:243 start_codon:yes stop_codon:yes gene_type:complete
MKNVENVINNPEYKKVFLILKAHVVTEFGKLNYSQVEDMKEANRTLKNLDRIESSFNRTLNDGKIAKDTLAKKLKRIVGK